MKPSMNKLAVVNELNQELKALSASNSIDYQWNGNVAKLTCGAVTCTVTAEPIAGDDLERIYCSFDITKQTTEHQIQFAAFKPSGDNEWSLSTNSSIGNKKDLDSVKECSSLILQMLEVATRLE